MNLQDSFLNQARSKKLPLTVFLVNGHQLKGNIIGFDAFVILLNADGKQIMIYKHAISTITPSKPITIFSGGSSLDRPEETNSKGGDF